jgi:Phosphoribosylglycinamide synthetase, ATP-grasp (A) domain
MHTKVMCCCGAYVAAVSHLHTAHAQLRLYSLTLCEHPLSMCAHANYCSNCAGGMGAYAPAPCLTPGLSKVCAAVCQQTVEAMAKEVHICDLPFVVRHVQTLFLLLVVVTAVCACVCSVLRTQTYAVVITVSARMRYYAQLLLTHTLLMLSIVLTNTNDY